MAKKGKRRRRPVLRSASSQLMFAVAGLPNTHQKETLSRLQDRFPEYIIKGVPSSLNDQRLYPKQLIETLVRSVGEFALRRRTNGNEQPAPSSITLLFIPSPDQEQLLRTFDFALMVSPLAGLAAFNDSWKQLRHDRDAAFEEISRLIGKSSQLREDLKQIERRLAYKSDNEAMLLPPNNFRLEVGTLSEIFRQFRDGRLSWKDRLGGLGPTDLNRDDVPSRIDYQQTRHVFVDQRGLAFFVAHPTAYDGRVRELEVVKDGKEEVAPPISQLISILRSLYRFGGALDQGFHHDVQMGDGSPLDGANFSCCEKGEIFGHSQYANVYPNDFVRVGDFTL